VVGKLVRAIADPRAADLRKADVRTGVRTAGTLSWIEPASGAAVRVPTSQVAHLQVGATVKVTLGAKVADGASGAGTGEPARQVLAASTVSPAAAAVTTPAPDVVTVVKVHPVGDTTADATTITDLVGDLNGPVADYWRNESQGAIQLTAAAAPDGDNWYTSTAGCSDPDALWADVAQHVGFVPGANKHLMLYLPNDPTALPDCEYGLGTVGSSLHGGGNAYVRDTITSVMAHELGHNFGLGHSSEMMCDRSVVNGNCGFADYYDLYDVMGASFDQVGSLSAPQANHIGVLPSNQVLDLSGHAPGTSTVTLTPMGVHTGTRAIKLGASDGVTYWLEYRSAVGQDAWLGDATANTPHLDQGVLIRAESSAFEDASYGDTSLLLDATPSPQAAWEGDDQEALKAGRSVWLSGLDYYITVKSTTAGPTGSAVVRVQAGETPLPRDLNRDFTPDLLAADSSGALYDYQGNGTGGFGSRSLVGRGWQTRDAIVMAGDMDGDGTNQDVLARDPAGTLWFYPGNGHGGFYAPKSLGGGWQAMNALLAPGDLTGDGNVDVLARRRSDGVLLLYPGTGTGGLRAPITIGKGWGAMTSFVSTGDWDLNGTSDFVVRNSAGALLLYSGNLTGGVSFVRTLASGGWNPYVSITGVGDWDGDGAPDLLARKSDGSMWLFAGNGTGGFGTINRIGGGWSAYRLAV
jgi:hypothetical protein